MSFKNICFKIDKKSLDHQHVEFDKWIALTQDCIRFLLEISVIDNDCQLYEMMPPSYRVPQKKNHNMYASYFAHFCHLCIFTKKKILLLQSKIVKYKLHNVIARAERKERIANKTSLKTNKKNLK